MVGGAVTVERRRCRDGECLGVFGVVRCEKEMDYGWDGRNSAMQCKVQGKLERKVLVRHLAGRVVVADVRLASWETRPVAVVSLGQSYPDRKIKSWESRLYSAKQSAPTPHQFYLILLDSSYSSLLSFRC